MKVKPLDVLKVVVSIALADRLVGAFGFARTAADAIVGDLVSHGRSSGRVFHPRDLLSLGTAWRAGTF